MYGFPKICGTSIVLLLRHISGNEVIARAQEILVVGTGINSQKVLLKKCEEIGIFNARERTNHIDLLDNKQPPI
jgi:hypothetical protein